MIALITYLSTGEAGCCGLCAVALSAGGRNGLISGGLVIFVLERLSVPLFEVVD